MKEVLTILRQQRLYAKKEKCDLVRSEVEFLGHRLGANGLAQEQEKAKAIKEWPTPTSKKEVRAFLGLAGYYRKFVARFSDIAGPLTDLTRDDVQFKWGGEEESAFHALKEALETAPVLMLPDATKPFVINTDASEYALGAVLQQEHEGVLKPVGFMSQKLSGSQTIYPTHDKEMLAIVEACAHWRHLLVGRPVLARSDHHSLQQFLEQRTLSKRQARWMEALAELDLTIQYVKGKSNVVADALSRRVDLQPEEKEEGSTSTIGAMGWRRIESCNAIRRRSLMDQSSGGGGGSGKVCACGSGELTGGGGETRTECQGGGGDADAAVHGESGQRGTVQGKNGERTILLVPFETAGRAASETVQHGEAGGDGAVCGERSSKGRRRLRCIQEIGRRRGDRTCWR